MAQRLEEEEEERQWTRTTTMIYSRSTTTSSILECSPSLRFNLVPLICIVTQVKIVVVSWYILTILFSQFCNIPDIQKFNYFFVHRCPKKHYFVKRRCFQWEFPLSYSLLQYFRDYNREIIELLRYATSSDCYTVSVIAYRMQYPDVVTSIVIHSATSGVFILFSLIFCVQIISNYIFYRLNRQFNFLFDYFTPFLTTYFGV